jgi:excisionase family DNA binding protein
MNDLPRWITVEQAAKHLNMPKSTLYKKIREKKIKVSPVGKPYRIDRYWLDGINKAI